MNDLEDLLREELHARVAAAEARQVEEPPTVLLGRLDQRIRRARLRQRWGAAALSAVGVGVAIALPVAVLSPGAPAGHRGNGGHHPRIPLSDTAATPSGWAPVAYGNAQISVPGDWLVSRRPPCGRTAPGYVVLGNQKTNLVVRNPRCRQPANTAAILIGPTGHVPLPATKINGIPVMSVQIMPSPDGSVSYFVPTLNATVTAHGPLARRVLATLTRSPLSVVLARGPAFHVPGSWRWHEFRGIRFAAPASWALVRNGHWNCPFYIARKTVTMIPAANSQLPSCGFFQPTAQLVTGHLGVIAGAGPYRGQDSSGYRHCRVLHGLRACYAAYGGLLKLAVFVPGRDRATLVQIGLGGNGAISRTIFESIRLR